MSFLFLSKSGAILPYGAKKKGNIVNCNKEKLANKAKKKEKERKKSAGRRTLGKRGIKDAGGI